MTDAAARISTGCPWPDGNVLYLKAEDDPADMSRPRLDVIGGDPANVAVFEAIRESNGTCSSLSLVRDLAVLAAAICGE
jgi:putative DNA primase/helicase